MLTSLAQAAQPVFAGLAGIFIALSGCSEMVTICLSDIRKRHTHRLVPLTVSVTAALVRMFFPAALFKALPGLGSLLIKVMFAALLVTACIEMSCLFFGDR